MEFSPLLQRATLIQRYKRFLADDHTDGRELTLHCPNTGAIAGCKRLAIPSGIRLQTTPNGNTHTPGN